MARRTLITGISSFTGPYIARELLELGHEIYGLGQVGDSQLEGVTCLQGNLLDTASLDAAIATSQPDYVIHLGAITFVPHGDVAEIYATNVVGTRNLLACLVAADRPLQKVLLASSANVYGNTVEGLLDESTPFSPANDYAVSKVAMEYMAAIWTDRLPVAFARPFNYTGRGQADKFLIPKIVTHFRDEKPVIELGNTDVIRDFSDVRFIAQAYAQLLDAAQPGEAYNLCSGADYSLNDVVQTMNQLAGYDIDVQVNPAFVRANDVRRLVGDNHKLLAACPELSPIPLSQTLSWMYASEQ